MKLMTISEVTRTFDISTRTLRYYDEIGLLPSTRKEDYAYRVYDESAVRRLQQILTLRKLRIPLKKIALIFQNAEQTEIVGVLQDSMNEFDGEIAALQTIRDILQKLIARLNWEGDTEIKPDILEQVDLFGVIQTLSLSKIHFKEESSMDELNKANEMLSKLKNVRIVVLPPCTVASYHFIGENPEAAVGSVVDKFVRESKLYEIKPDARMFGFNHPNPSPDRPFHGYEDWVTIPDDMEVPAPLVKKQFAGGMYAAHTIQFPDFHEWKLLRQWVEESETYAANYSKEGGEIMSGCLEEHLNWIYTAHMGWPETGRIDGYLDLLLPIKLK
jgi:DNA-binding transcriptional MerR regulator/DNA gyrase inhibitor GyrI